MKHLLATAVLLHAFADAAGLAAQGAPPGFPPQGRGGGPPRSTREPAGTAVIRGRILTADTGTPVRRAQVRAILAGSRATRTIADRSVLIGQAGTDSHNVSPVSVAAPAYGQVTTINVTTAAGLAWTVSSNASWLVITSPAIS